MTTDEQAFLVAIDAAPFDDAPKLIFADWLDEHDEHERADKLRKAVRLRRVWIDFAKVVSDQISVPMQHAIEAFRKVGEAFAGNMQTTVDALVALGRALSPPTECVPFSGSSSGCDPGVCNGSVGTITISDGVQPIQSWTITGVVEAEPEETAEDLQRRRRHAAWGVDKINRPLPATAGVALRSVRASRRPPPQRPTRPH